MGAVIQASLLNWRQWWVSERWWIGHFYSLRLFEQSMPICNGYILKMEINGQTIEDGVRHSCSFLSRNIYLEKFAYNPLTAWKVKLKTHMGEVLDVLGELQCSVVCKGKRYYPPILVGDYDGKLTLLCKNWLRLILSEWSNEWITLYCVFTTQQN